MGKKVLRLFLETMLRAVVIILAVGIVVIGALLIKTLVKNNSLKDSKKTTTGKEIVTEAEDENDPTFNNGDDENSGSDGADETGAVASTDAKILVINATGTSGVAGAWKTALEGKGYTSVEVGTYNQSAIATSKVCVSGSYDGADLAAEFSSPEMSTTDTLSASDFDVPIAYLYRLFIQTEKQVLLQKCDVPAFFVLNVIIYKEYFTGARMFVYNCYL